MRHLGYALVALLCAWSIAVAAPKKKAPKADPKKAPPGQKLPAPNVPKQVDPKVAAELTRLQTEYNIQTGKQAHLAALKLAKQIYELQIKATGADSMEVEWKRVTLAGAYQMAGDQASAERTYREHVQALTKKYGADSSQVLQAYQLMTSVMYGGGRLEELEAIQLHIIAATKKLHGEKSTEYASALSSHAMTLSQKNEWGATLRRYEEVLKVYESMGKPDDWTIVTALQSIANTYWQMNQQAKAIALYDRIIKLAKSSTNQMFSLRVVTIWVTASQYQWGGRKDLAGPLFKTAIEMTEQEIARLEKSAPDDWQLSSMLSQLGAMHRANGDIAKAEQAYIRYDKWATKKGQYSAAAVLLADIKRLQGKNKEAIALYEKAREDINKMSPGAGVSYNVMIADIYREMGDFKTAIQLFESYKAHMNKTLASHPTALGGIELMAVNYYAGAGKYKEAEAALARSLEVSEKELQNVLRVGTDTDHAIYFSKQSNVLDTPLNFNLNYQPKSGTAARLALTTVLRRKGRLLDAAAAALATIRAKLSKDDKKLLDELNNTRAQLAKLTVAGPGVGADTAAFGKEIAVLEDKVQRLEAQVSKKSAAYRTVTQPISLAGVQKMIPKDARLVELVNYQPHDTKWTYATTATGNYKARPRRYLAYVAATKGDPVFVDLGDAAPIDKAIESYRKALADPDNDSIADLGKSLHDLTFAKIAPKLGGATNILIAPDGALNVVPFSALVDDKKEFLIKKYTFTYLTSGRDLLRLTAKTKAQGGGVLFADPKFDDTGKKSEAGKTRGARSADLGLSALQWPQLPGTAAEADAIVKSFKGFKVYRGEAATEGTIKQVKGPRILHLATHGFFLPDDEKPPVENDRGASPMGPMPGGAGPTLGQTMYENPLLRSGLAFAGANKLVSGDDDGLLTALEASGLDLWGTKLVVLSACETGVGKVTNGDGVYGLRRSLVIAGAESLVMSMWQVDDFATKELMSGFYKRLAAGKPRSQALRDVQLELLAKPKYAHPFYWAAFLPAGATTPLKD